MNVKTKKIIFICIHLFIFISTLIITVTGIIRGPSNAQNGNDFMRGFGYFIPFTVDSNELSAICSLVLAFVTARGVKDDNWEMPYPAKVMHLVGATAVALTFITVVMFLAPMKIVQTGNVMNYFGSFKNDMFFFHFINPLITCFSLIFMVSGKQFSGRARLYAVMPAVVYALIYLFEVVVVKNWKDFYGFTFGGKYALIPVVMIVIIGASYGMACLITFLHNKKLLKNKVRC